MNNLNRFTCTIIFTLFVAVSAQKSLAQCVIINEVLINAAGNCDGNCVPSTAEWLELYNPCGNPVNIGCFFITDGDFHFPNNQSDLPYEQRQILREAVKELRRRYSLLPDPGRILDDEFTLSQLREVHEAIQDTEIAPDTFRREMLPNLKATGHRAEGFVGKPPMMYRRKDRRESTVRTSRMLSARMIATDEFM